MIEELVRDLRAEARATDERRLLVLTGDRNRCWHAAMTALDAADIDPATVVCIGDPPTDLQARSQTDAEALLGTTQQAVILDAHDRLEPTTLGRTVGTVAGGGLYILLAPPLDEWPNRRDAFDATLAVPPADLDDVTGHFRRRFVDLLKCHPGIAIIDVDRESVRRDGLVDPAPRLDEAETLEPTAGEFPQAAYDSCRTADQRAALRALESLREAGNAVVLAADRGRGKSSLAGLAAGALALDGKDILVTAPEFQNAREVFERAIELLDGLEALEHVSGSSTDLQATLETGSSETVSEAGSLRITATAGGSIEYRDPATAVEDGAIERAEVVIVDEAAAIPVHRLQRFLDAASVAFVTTVHGYEGTGRGFAVRFRDRLQASDYTVSDVSMREPIRYAAGDPIEVWAFRALCLDASPAPDQLVADASPDSTTYQTLSAPALLDDEVLLQEVFGLLVLAHYRTEPNDLARLLDAPNVSVRVLLEDGHVASVALLAREGGLDAELRARMYEGGRVRGNMLPDVLTGQLGDEAAAVPVGWRVMRIATHPACRSQGLGSHLLGRIDAEARTAVDWVGTGFGATPELVSFWRQNGYRTVHLSITRNDRSGEHSVLMLSPLTDRGTALFDRHTTAFLERIGAILTDALSSLDPDIVRAVLRSAVTPAEIGLDDAAWRRIARMAEGPGLLDIDPAPFRQLARYHLTAETTAEVLSAREERILVFRVLQANGWTETVARFDYPSRRACMLAIGDIYAKLVSAYGTDTARSVTQRFTDEE